MKPFVMLTDGSGSPVIIDVNSIGYVEEIGPNHEKRKGYDDLLKGTDRRIMSLVTCHNGDRTSTVPCLEDVATIWTKLHGVRK